MMAMNESLISGPHGQDGGQNGNKDLTGGLISGLRDQKDSQKGHKDPPNSRATPEQRNNQGEGRFTRLAGALAKKSEREPSPVNLTERSETGEDSSDAPSTYNEQAFLTISRKPRKQTQAKGETKIFLFPVMITPEDNSPLLFQMNIKQLNEALTKAFEPTVDVKRIAHGRRILISCSTSETQKRALGRKTVGGIKVSCTVPNPPKARTEEAKALGVLKPIHPEEDLAFVEEELRKAHPRARVLKRLTIRDGKTSRAILIQFPGEILPKIARIGGESIRNR